MHFRFQAAGRSAEPAPPTPAGACLLELDAAFVAQACGSDPCWRAAGEESHPKILSLAAALVEAGDAVPNGVRLVLWTALARTLGRHLGGVAPRRDDAWLNPAALIRVANAVEAGMHSALPVAQLARAAGLSPSAFLRAFRGTVGATPGAYVIERRVAQAEDLATSTAVPLATIASWTGFRTAAHLSATFKARRGVSPRSLRSGRGAPVPTRSGG